MKAEVFSARFSNRGKYTNKFIRFSFQSIELLVRHGAQALNVIQPKRRLVCFLQRNSNLVYKILFRTSPLGSPIVCGCRTRTSNNLIGRIPTCHRSRHRVRHLRDTKGEPQKSLTKLIMHFLISTIHRSLVSKFSPAMPASSQSLTSPFLLLPWRGGTTPL